MASIKLYIHQIRQTGQNGAIIALFVHYNFDFKIIRRTNICNDDIEYLIVEVLRNKSKNNFFLYLQTSKRSFMIFFG